MRGVSALGITCLDLYVWFGGELSLSALVSVGIVEVEAVCSLPRVPSVASERECLLPMRVSLEYESKR